jgi:hypothetical protein
MKTTSVRYYVIFLFSLCFLGKPQIATPQGHWEIGFHYSKWSIDLLRSVIEDGINDALETELKDRILEDIQADYPSLVETGYSQEIQFDSGGDNFGFEVRWYPGGETGSFSLGLSMEKTTMRVSLPEVSAAMSLRDQATSTDGNFNGTASGEFLLKPWSFHLSFRWDILPTSVVHPYFTFGLGAATGTALEEAKVSYSYAGDLAVPGEATKSYSDAATKSLKQLKEEQEEEGEDFFLPNFIPFLQLSLGLKAVITPNIHLLIDAGVWNGFLIRGGISIRL